MAGTTKLFKPSYPEWGGFRIHAIGAIQSRASGQLTEKTQTAEVLCAAKLFHPHCFRIVIDAVVVVQFVVSINGTTVKILCFYIVLTPGTALEDWVK